MASGAARWPGPAANPRQTDSELPVAADVATPPGCSFQTQAPRTKAGATPSAMVKNPEA
jgi:hypothetical protein